jgi:hypothetical protein
MPLHSVLVGVRPDLDGEVEQVRDRTIRTGR